MIKSRLLRHMVESKSYYENRMDEMDRKCAFYLDNGMKASNQKLRTAFIQTAAMYYKRYKYYFKKISGYELR